jgi:hypothetical protein
LTGGHVRSSNEVLPKISEPEKNISEISSTQEVSLNWKNTLEEILCKNPEQINSERAWAKLCSRIRDLCPETSWFSICEDTEINQLENIQAIGFWLETMISGSEWPFPVKVIVTSTKDSWKILFSEEISKLPFATPPAGLTITPWRDKHTSGWKIKAIDSFNVIKEGEA